MTKVVGSKVMETNREKARKKLQGSENFSCKNHLEIFEQ